MKRHWIVVPIFEKIEGTLKFLRLERGLTLYKTDNISIYDFKPTITVYATNGTHWWRSVWK